MPLIIDPTVLESGEFDESTVVSLVEDKPRMLTPKFFSSELTGNGKSTRGRLHAGLTPALTADVSKAPSMQGVTRKRTIKNDKLTTYHIPVQPLARYTDELFTHLVDTYQIKEIPANLLFPDVAQDNLRLLATTTTQALIASVEPSVIIMTKEEKVDVTGTKSNIVDTHIYYRIATGLIDLDDPNVNMDKDKETVTIIDPDVDVIISNPDVAYSLRPKHDIRLNNTMQSNNFDLSLIEVELDEAEKANLDAAIASQRFAQIVLPNNPADEDKYYSDSVSRWLADDYSIYQRLCRGAEVINDHQGLAQLCRLLQLCFTKYQLSDAKLLSGVAFQLSYLESFDISLNEYQDLFNVFEARRAWDDQHVHAAMRTALDSQIIDDLLSQNMQLMLNGNLSKLAAISDKLPTVTDNPSAPYSMPPMYSTQQRGAITAGSGLTLVASGAGTGKSTVISERIDYLTHCGVDPKSIMVLSFTNAAADNIAEKKPGVYSTTFDKQIMAIYENNFPNQIMSSLSTIINAIEIEYATQLVQQDAFVLNFLALLRSVDGNEVSGTALTKLNTFIAVNLNRVIALLNSVGQYSLELQMIICYQMINTIAEPHTPPTHIIIDEVQDTSLFQFAYILKYAIKHEASLYIVGDASQTLYEFRAANPKALNSLERSGIFDCHRLTTNYRSNQEVLDFANIHLNDIEANAYAKIQLNSNALDQVTSESFQEKIHLVTMHSNNLNKAKDDVAIMMRRDAVTNYIDDCLARGEQVAFLAYSRLHVHAMVEALEAMYPQATHQSLMSDRIVVNTLFSSYIAKYWDEVTSVDPANAPFVFTQQVPAHAAQLGKPVKNKAARDKRLDKSREYVSKWWTSNSETITAWVHSYQQGGTSKDEFFAAFKDNIMKYEIATNKMAQQLTGQRNRSRKEQASADVNFFSSTIHGVKGLEFDNVVLLHASSDRDQSEAMKRLYYVALTRAKKSELIMAYSKDALPRLVTDYRDIVANLEAAERKAAASAQQAQLLADTEDDDADAQASAQAEDVPTTTVCANNGAEPSSASEVAPTPTEESADLPAESELPSPSSFTDLILSLAEQEDQQRLDN